MMVTTHPLARHLPTLWERACSRLSARASGVASKRAPTASAALAFAQLTPIPPADLLAHVQPVSDRPLRWRLRADDSGTEIALAPFCAVHHQRHVVYWPCTPRP